MRDIYTLQERIKQGNQAIRKAQEKGKDTIEWIEHLCKLESRLSDALHQIQDIKLSEFEKQSYSTEVFSTVLNRTVWFCSDKEMAALIKRENPEAVCYTPAELRHLLSLNPGPESLKLIHDAKTVFPSSSIAESIPSKKS